MLRPALRNDPGVGPGLSNSLKYLVIVVLKCNFIQTGDVHSLRTDFILFSFFG